MRKSNKEVRFARQKAERFQRKLFVASYHGIYLGIMGSLVGVFIGALLAGYQIFSISKSTAIVGSALFFGMLGVAVPLVLFWPGVPSLFYDMSVEKKNVTHIRTL